MSDGLVTRVGKWIDSKFEDKALASDLQRLEATVGALRMLIETESGRMLAVEARLSAIPADLARYLEDLKGRIEKVELYAGMTRKVDPTKPPIAKSAFSM